MNTPLANRSFLANRTLLAHRAVAPLIASAIALANVACVGAHATDDDIATMQLGSAAGIDDGALPPIPAPPEPIEDPATPPPAGAAETTAELATEILEDEIATCLSLPTETEDVCAAPRSDCIGEYVWRTGDIDACAFHAWPNECSALSAIDRFDLDACENDAFFADEHPFVGVMETYLGYRFDDGADKGRWACVFNIVRHRGVSELCSTMPIDFSGGQDCETHVDEFAQSTSYADDVLFHGRCR